MKQQEKCGKIKLISHEFKNELNYANLPMVKYSIKYPEFLSHQYQFCTGRINNHFMKMAESLDYYCRKALYGEAVQFYRETVINDYPFHGFEFVAQYDVTQNSGGLLSAYYDVFQYMGGANGTLRRESYNWDMKKCRKIMLRELFPGEKNFPVNIFAEIYKQIEERLKDNEGYYFDQYRELVRENFKPENFYIRNGDIIVFFQETTIAPHSSGVVEFTFKMPAVPSGVIDND